jgi:hypothetical protein
MLPSLIVGKGNEYEVCTGKGQLSGIGVSDSSFGESVIVKRNLSKDIGEQCFIPNRFLLGLLPSGILGILSNI